MRSKSLPVRAWRVWRGRGIAWVIRTVRRRARPFLSPVLWGPVFAATRLASVPGFTVDGDRLKYFRIPFYNDRAGVWTWHTERAVEVALVERFLGFHSGAGLEVGNVMNNYLDPPARVVVDKYEQWPGVLNIDILDYHPDVTFDWIVTCSTLEHVGWDEDPVDPDKALRALHHLRGLLSPTGTLLVTVPLGHHPNLDAAIFEGTANADRSAVFTRHLLNRWTQVGLASIGQPTYNYRRMRACALWVGEFTRREGA